MGARTMTEASVTALPPDSGLFAYGTGWTVGRAQGLRGIVSGSVRSAAPDGGGWSDAAHLSGVWKGSEIRAAVRMVAPLPWVSRNETGNV